MYKHSHLRFYHPRLITTRKQAQTPANLSEPLNEIFLIDNSAITSAKAERIDKQYYVTSAPVRNEVIALIRNAEVFNATLLDATDRLTHEKKDMFRQKLKKLF